MEEYDRILSNPDNLIVSDGLLDRLGEPEQSSSVEAALILDDQKIACHLISYSCGSKGVSIKLNVGHVGFKSIFLAKSLQCEIFGEVFEFSNDFTYENDESTAILILSTSGIEVL